MNRSGPSSRGAHSRLPRRPGARHFHQRHLGRALVWSLALHGVVLLGFMRVAEAPPGPGFLEVFPMAAHSEGPHPADAQPAGQAEPFPSLQAVVINGTREGSRPSRGASTEPTQPRPAPQQPASGRPRDGGEGARGVAPGPTPRDGKASSPALSGDSRPAAAAPPPPQGPPAQDEVVLLASNSAVLAATGADAPGSWAGLEPQHDAREPGPAASSTGASREPDSRPAAHPAGAESRTGHGTTSSASFELRAADVLVPVAATARPTSSPSHRGAPPSRRPRRSRRSTAPSRRSGVRSWSPTRNRPGFPRAPRSPRPLPAPFAPRR